MSLSKLFRFATFACLFLSTATLAYAEAQPNQLANSAAFYVAILTTLIVCYFGEDRWLLPRGLANWVAAAIFFAWAAWFAFGGGLTWEDADPIGSVLPRAGPLLGLLLLAKLFRPKQAIDYWLLHALALVQVLLAAVLALRSRLDRDDALFSALLLGYVVNLVWSLTLFNVYRDGEVSGAPAQALAWKGRRKEGARLPWRTLGMGSSIGWSVVAFTLGLVAFFAIPRPGQEVTASIPAILPGAPMNETGFNPIADLTQTGPISASDAEVMKVEAFDQGNRKVMLDADSVRFRGSTCSEYGEGKWRPWPGSLATQNVHDEGTNYKPKNPVRVVYNLDVTKMRSGSWLDQYEPTQNLSLFLMEPIYLAGNVSKSPIAFADRNTGRAAINFTYKRDEPALSAPVSRRMRRLIYTQMNAMPPDNTPAEEWSDDVAIPVEMAAAQGMGRLPWWQTLKQKLPPNRAQELLEKKTNEILASAKLPTLDPAREDRLTPAERRDLAVKRAKAMEHYLVTSPDYSYTLDHVRQDASIDPTVDFVCNVKQGHCELYASALALMLRTCGIPARVVIGFRGADYNSVGDWYEVRQYHAHSWVEAFIEKEPLKRGAQPNKPIIGKWLTLDPTPAGGTAAVSSVKRSGSLDDLISFVQFLWEFFVLDYTGDIQQARLKARLRDMKLDEVKRFWEDFLTAAPRGLLVLAGIGLVATIASGAWFISRLRWRRRHAAFFALAARFPFYAHFLRLAQRVGLRPMPSQTAAEVGMAFTEQLRARPAAADAIDVPADVAANFYDLRYGGYALDPERTRIIDRLLQRLEQALKRKA